MTVKRPWKVCTLAPPGIGQVLASCSSEDAALRSAERHRREFDKIVALRSVSIAVFGPRGQRAGF